MTVVPSLSVVIALGGAGRAVLPTLRSVISAEDLAEAEIVVVCEASGLDALRTIIAQADLPEGPEIRTAPAAGGLAAQRNAGLALARSQIVAVVDAGDLVDSLWISRSLAIVETSPDEIVHPEVIITFGSRSGWWPQPENERGRAVLPIAAAWASVAMAQRAIWQRCPYRLVADEVVDAVWQADTSLRSSHRLAPGTSAFVRVWAGEAAPWEPIGPVALPPLEFLSDEDFAATIAQKFIMREPERRRAPGWMPRVARGARSVSQPWIAAARRLRQPAMLGSQRTEASWRRANALEPLIPFPSPEVSGWYERAETEVRRQELVAHGYWYLIDRIGRPDYLYFAPWVRTGGGDVVLRQYLSSVLRQRPTDSVALMTTEPGASTHLDEVPSEIRVAQADDLLSRGIHRDDLVRSIVPAMISQIAPRVVHAFNSTVAFDAIERVGPRIVSDTRLFLSTFAIDRQEDGERTSVLFLRPPAFLDDISAVLVDSQYFIDQVVRELGYARERFIVQRSVVDLARRRRAVAPGEPLRVVWAGRFDIAKRVDLLVPILREARRARLPIELHYYGAAVMGHEGLQPVFRELARLGAVRHPPFRQFSDLPVDEVDAYLMTSEWEGVPLSMLEAMASGIPVIAPLVGGVGEVLSNRTGWPVERFDDASAYVHALQLIASDQLEASARAACASALVAEHFSSDAFDRSLRSVPGYLIQQ